MVSASPAVDLTASPGLPGDLARRLAAPAQPRRPDPLAALLAATRQGIAASEPDLTQRQLAVLLSVHLDPGPHTVRGLAETLGLPKPTITRALDRLGDLRLARRTADPRDRRSVLVVPTEAGGAHLAALRARMHAAEG